MLEKYSQQHEHMFVRARRHQNKRKKADAQKKGVDDDAAEENEEVLIAESKRATTERAFDFQKFESKYLNHSCIDSFIKFLSYYKELDGSQIMRAIKFFHRIFEKRKMEILLYRLDYVDLFYRMMQGGDSLPKSHPAYKEADQFVRHYLRKLFKKLEKEHALYVEVRGYLLIFGGVY
jgi:replication fork protection complex subunit Tof1/Swi1